MSKKLVWRTIPIDLYDYSSMEGWLEHMAQKGYQPQKAFAGRVGFEQSDFPHTRCRLVPMEHSGDEPEPEFLEACREQGWEYVTSLSDLYHLYLTHDPEAPELFTDPVTEDWMLRHLDRRGRRTSGLLGVLCVLAVALIQHISRSDSFNLWRLCLSPYWLVLLACCIPLFLYPALGRQLRKRRVRLRAGIPVEHGEGWEKACRTHRISAALRIATWVLLAILVFLPNSAVGTRDLSEMPIPFLSLNQVEASGGQEAGYFKTGFSPLAPFQIQTNQSLGDSRLSFTCYDLTFSAMAVPMAEDMATHYIDEVFPSLYQRTEVPADSGFDYLAAAQRADGGGWLLVAARKGKVAYLRYSGPADLRDSLEDLRAVMEVSS